MENFENDTFLMSKQTSDLKIQEPITQTELLINFKQILGLTVGLIHVINSGIMNGYGSVIIAQLESNESFPIKKIEASWIVSIAMLLMVPGCLLCGLLLNIASKKTLLTMIAIFECASYLILYASTSVKHILIGRALSGFTMSIGATIIPIYLAEIAHSNARGLFLSLVYVSLASGVLVIHAMGALLTWNMCALVSALSMAIFLGLILYLPETYVWHLRNGNIEKAQIAFYYYRGCTLTSKMELEKLITRNHENNRKNYSAMKMLRVCCSKLLLMPLGISCVAMVTFHLSGSKAIMIYSISFISQVIPSLDQYTSTIIVDVVRIIMTGAGSYLVNKYPVRPLYILSGVGSAISHFCFSAFFSYVDSENASQLFPILSLLAVISYTIFSSIDIAPLVWVIAGEVFPIIVKGVGSGLCTFASFLTLFIMVKTTPDIFDVFGIPGAFVLFGCCTAIGTIIMYFILPETKNKTLKEVEDLFR